MRQILCFLFCLLFIVPVVQVQEEELPSHVIVISLDGARPDGLQDALYSSIRCFAG